MHFTIDTNLLTHCRAILDARANLYWLVGGAGAGKTTVSQALHATQGLVVYDMDAHIYGSYHGRFVPARHPVNRQWSSAADGLAWLLQMTWAEFDGFHRAALPEYLDLLAEDLGSMPSDTRILVDGGIWHPALLAQVLPPSRIVCLAAARSSCEVWEGSADRLAMRDALLHLADAEAMWRKFLDFDLRITQTIVTESRACGIAVCVRGDSELVGDYAARIAAQLGLAQS
jgi:hypothetical protein